MTNPDFSKNRKKVAVIGAGIVGVSAAIWLQRKGHEVVLIDRSGPAAGTSYGNAGVLAACAVVPVTVPGLLAKAPKMLFDPDAPLFLRWGYLIRMLPWLGKYLGHCNPYDVKRIALALTQILADSLQQHQELAEGTEAAGFINPTDYMFVYDSKQEFDKESFSWEIREQCGFEWQEHNREQLVARDPAFAAGNAQFAVTVGKHGWITDPGRYVSTLADAFVKQGGEFKIGLVEDIARDGDAVRAVKLESEMIACDAAIMATGIWSESLSRKLGIVVPMEAERGYHMEFYDASRMPAQPTMISSGKFVATPMQGRLRCAGIVEFGGLSQIMNRKPLELLKRQLSIVMPDLKYERTEQWMGFRPSPTDSIPLIGEFARLRNMYAGFGHQHVGLTGGAKTGRILASLISGEDPGIDLTPYNPDRFAQ